MEYLEIFWNRVKFGVYSNPSVLRMFSSLAKEWKQIKIKKNPNHLLSKILLVTEITCWTSQKQILKQSTICIFQHFSCMENTIFEQAKTNYYFSIYLKLKDSL